MSEADQFYEETVKKLNEKIAQLTSILDQNRSTIRDLSKREQQTMQSLRSKRQIDYPKRQAAREKSFETLVNEEVENYKKIIFWICTYGYDPEKPFRRSPDSFDGPVFFIGNYKTMKATQPVLTKARKFQFNNSLFQLDTLLEMMETYKSSSLNVPEYSVLDYPNKLDEYINWEAFICVDYNLLGTTTPTLNSNWAYYPNTVKNGPTISKLNTFDIPTPENALIQAAAKVPVPTIPINTMAKVKFPHGIFLIGDKYMTDANLTTNGWIRKYSKSIMDSIFPFLNEGEDVMIFNGHSGYTYGTSILLREAVYKRYPKNLFNSIIMIELTKELIRRGYGKYINSIRILNLTT